MLKTAVFVATLSSAAVVVHESNAIDPTPTSAPGGPDAQSLASILVDGINVILGPTPASITGDFRAIGKFEDGLTEPGTSLPDDNQNSAGNAEYAGGISVVTGVCLCSGLLSDDDATIPLGTGRGVGIEGPNNGDAITASGPVGQPMNEGEVSLDLGQSPDSDFQAWVNDTDAESGDAIVLELQIELTSPCFLRSSFVFASDENPAWIQEDGGNDAIAILIDDENIATLHDGTSLGPFTLFAAKACGQALFIENQIAPSPNPFPITPHAIPTPAPYYDIEFGGFTKLLTRETSKVLAPGRYPVKIVVQDVNDRVVDSAAFLPAGSLAGRAFMCADFDLDGDVDGDDMDIVLFNFNQPVSCFEEGDATGNGMVDGADLDLVLFNFNTGGGHADYEADFNYDGQVDHLDLAILNEYKDLLLTCASRAEGDANLDGRVDSLDQAIFDEQENSTSGNATCGSPVAALGGGAEAYQIAPQTAATSDMRPERFAELDHDKDGDLDKDDVRLWAEYLKAN